MPAEYIVLIACVTTETVMVSDPVRFYQPREVHIFRYTRDPGTPKARLYDDHLREVRRQIADHSPLTEVYEHAMEPVYDFRRMARSLEALYLHLQKEHPGCRVLANMSSGPSEFVAAVEFLASANPGVTKFKVSTREYALDEADFRDLYYVDGRPVGLSRSVSDPREVESVHIGKPDEVLVRSLRIYAHMLDNRKEPMAIRMIASLKRHGLWAYRPIENEGRASAENKERTNYYRRYVNMWKAMGWIDSEDHRKHHRLTEQGRAVIEMFYVEAGHHRIWF